MGKEREENKDKNNDQGKDHMTKNQNQKKTEDLLKEKDNQIAEYEKRIEKIRFDNMLDGKLTDSRAKNKLAVRALLDMDKIMVDEDKLIGVDEQISSIKAKDGYLFENATTGGGANPSHVKETVDMDALSDKEYFKMKHGK